MLFFKLLKYLNVYGSGLILPMILPMIVRQIRAEG
jgi:hypothetical protein